MNNLIRQYGPEPNEPSEQERAEIEARIAALRQQKIAKAESGEPQWTMPMSRHRTPRRFRKGINST